MSAIATHSRIRLNKQLISAGMHASGNPRLVEAAAALTPAPPRSLPADESNYLVARAMKVRMIPMLHRYMTQHGLESVPDVDALCRIIAITNEVTSIRLLPLLKDLNSRVDLSLIKGAAFAKTYYPADLPRQMADVDLLVMPGQLNTATDFFSSHGFFQGEFNRNTMANRVLPEEEYARFVANHYELPPFLEIIRVEELDPFVDLIKHHFQPRDYMLPVARQAFVLLEVDVHFNLSFDLALDDVWGNATVPIDGQDFRTLEATTNVWFLAARIYVEATAHHESPIRALVDLMTILASSPDIDWDHIMRMAEKYGLQFPLYYTLSAVDALCSDLVPKPALDLLRNFADAHVTHHQNKGNFWQFIVDAPLLLPCAV